MNDVIVAGGKLSHFHIAAFFRSREEEYEVLRSYIREGIDAGEKAIHICDPHLKHDHLQHLERMGVPISDCTRTGQLEVLGWHDTYLKEGRFDGDSMMVLLEEAVKTSQAEGFSRVRLMGHMEWAVEEPPGMDRLMEYEACVNHLLNRLKQPAICVYDLNRFNGAVIIDALRTHPYVIVEGVLRENSFYAPPEEFLANSRAKGQRT